MGQTNQDKRGIWVPNGGVWAKPIPDGFIDGMYMNQGFVPVTASEGLRFDSSGGTIVAPPGETETALQFLFAASATPSANPSVERRFFHDALDEYWLKTRIYIPTNYFHQFCGMLSITGDISAWQEGDAILGANGTSTATLYQKSSQTLYTLFPTNPDIDSAWTGTITNTTRGQTAASVRNPSPTSNRKLIALWADGYSTAGKGPTFVFEFRFDGQGGSNLYYHWSTDNTVTGTLEIARSAEVPFVRMEDVGKWFDIFYHIKMASSDVVADGVVGFYLKREGESVYTKLLGQNNASTHPRAAATPPNCLMRAGYFYGAWNSGVKEAMSMYLSEVEIYDSRPAELGAA